VLPRRSSTAVIGEQRTTSKDLGKKKLRRKLLGFFLGRVAPMSGAVVLAPKHRQASGVDTNASTTKWRVIRHSIKKRESAERIYLSALTWYFNRLGETVGSSLMRRVVASAAINCDVGLFALRHHHVDAALGVLLRIVNDKANPVNAAVTAA
jgi:hypothetical protein